MGKTVTGSLSELLSNVDISLYTKEQLEQLLTGCVLKRGFSLMPCDVVGIITEIDIEKDIYTAVIY